jgi:hypothetical protein
MRIGMLSALMLGAFSGLATAEDVNLDSRPETTTVALSSWSVGPGIGVLGVLSGDLNDESPQFLSLSLAQSVRFRENWDLGIDLDWWAPGNNYGGALSLSYLFGDMAVKPFLGVGVGLRSVDYEGQSFGHGLGAEASAYAGAYLDVLDNLQLRVRVPYRFIANSPRDQVAGLDISLLFSSSQRTTKVKKLKY